MLTNSELYIYRDEQSKDYMEMHVLTPAAYVVHHPPLRVQGQDFNLVYPIELLLRGGANKKSTMIYFDIQDQYSRWLKKLENATNGHRIQDYYKQTKSPLYFVYSQAEGIKFGELRYKPKEYGIKDISEIEWPNIEGKVIVFEGIHLASQRNVDIKMICKQGMTLAETESLREEIGLFRATSSNGVIRLFDYFESDEFLYLCLERHICYISSLGGIHSPTNVTELSLGAKKDLQEVLMNTRNQPQPLEHFVMTTFENNNYDVFREIKAMELIKTII